MAGVLWALFTYSLSFSPGGALDPWSWAASPGSGLRGVGRRARRDPGRHHPAHAPSCSSRACSRSSPPPSSRARWSSASASRPTCSSSRSGAWSSTRRWRTGSGRPGGWLRNLGVLDFAGGTVVHINAAAAALVGAILLGKRRGLRAPTVLPHNVPFAILGMGLLWFGWLGFNGGSALAANGLASSAFANTFFAPAAAALTWGLIELFLHDKMSGVGLASGAVAGMVAITPAAGFVTPPRRPRHRRAGRLRLLHRRPVPPPARPRRRARRLRGARRGRHAGRAAHRRLRLHRASTPAAPTAACSCSGSRPWACWSRWPSRAPSPSCSTSW